jgi:hypothetical protein
MKKRPLGVVLYVTSERQAYSDDGAIRFELSLSPDPAERDACEKVGEYPRPERWPAKIGELNLRDTIGAFAWPAKGRAPEVGFLAFEARNVYSAAADELRSKAKTLDKIHGALRRTSEKYGRADTFEAWIRRVCTVVGVSRVRIDRETILRYRKIREHETFDGRFLDHSPEDGARAVEHAIRAVVDPTKHWEYRAEDASGETH